MFRVAWALEVAVGAAGAKFTTWWQGFTIPIEFEKQFAAAPDEAGVCRALLVVLVLH